MGAAVDRAYLGCYALDAELPKWANAFPARFALDEMVIADTTPERRMIRAVTPDGKIDGPIASAWWQTTPITTGGSGGSTSAEITWTTGPAPLHLTIGLTPGEGGVRATVRDVSRAEVIRVTRISCSP